MSSTLIKLYLGLARVNLSSPAVIKSSLSICSNYSSEFDILVSINITTPYHSGASFVRSSGKTLDCDCLYFIVLYLSPDLTRQNKATVKCAILNAR